MTLLKKMYYKNPWNISTLTISYRINSDGIFSSMEKKNSIFIAALKKIKAIISEKMFEFNLILKNCHKSQAA